MRLEEMSKLTAIALLAIASWRALQTSLYLSPIDPSWEEK